MENILKNMDKKVSNHKKSTKIYKSETFVSFSHARILISMTINLIQL